MFELFIALLVYFGALLSGLLVFTSIGRKSDEQLN
jgi:hypothetical protein